MLEIGDQAPPFTLPISGGENLSIPTGKPFVLFFYPKDDTPGCTIEANEFSQNLEQFSHFGVEVFGISPDTIKKHDKFISKHNLTTPLIADEEKIALGDYGVWVEKSMYGRTYMGVQRTTILANDQGQIVEIWHKVKVKGHVDAVLSAAKQHFG